MRVSYRDGRLSVSVKKQPLTAVLDRLAMMLGVNFTMKEDSAETVDLNFKELSLEDAMSYTSLRPCTCTCEKILAA